MHVPVFKLCRHAAQLIDGTMMLTAIVRVVRPNHYPAPFPPLVLAIEIEWDPIDADRELITRILDDDGRLVWQLPLLADVHRGPSGATVSDWLMLNMGGVCPIDRPGDYLVELVAEDNVLNWTRVRFATI